MRRGDMVSSSRNRTALLYMSLLMRNSVGQRAAAGLKLPTRPGAVPRAGRKLSVRTDRQVASLFRKPELWQSSRMACSKQWSQQAFPMVAHAMTYEDASDCAEAHHFCRGQSPHAGFSARHRLAPINRMLAILSGAPGPAPTRRARSILPSVSRFLVSV
jgi:hypothetical protein